MKIIFCEERSKKDVIYTQSTWGENLICKHKIDPNCQDNGVSQSNYIGELQKRCDKYFKSKFKVPRSENHSLGIQNRY